MIRTFSSIIIFFLTFSISQAQSWQLVKTDTVQYIQKQFYDFGMGAGIAHSSNVFGLTLVIDSSISNHTGSITYFMDDYSALGSEYDSCAYAGPSIFGDSMIVRNDTVKFFVDTLNPILWLSNSSSWTLYSNGPEHLQIQMDSVKANGNDSLRYYSINVNASANSELQQFDTAQMVVSKSNGMIKGFDLSYFPDTLIELNYLRQGSLTNREIYDYEIGDEIHFQTYGWLMNPAGLHKYIHKIINKVVHNSDSTTYTIEQIYIDQQNSITVDTIQKTYQLNKVISDGIFVDGDNPNPIYSTLLFSDHYSLPAYILSSEYIFLSNPFCRTKLGGYKFEEFVFGIGKFTHIFDGTSGNPQQYHEILLYYKKGTETWGTPIIISSLRENQDEKLQFYPNPVEEKLVIEGFGKNAHFELYDLNGRMVMQSDLRDHKDVLNTVNISEGIYLLKVYTSAKTISKKINVR